MPFLLPRPQPTYTHKILNRAQSPFTVLCAMAGISASNVGWSNPDCCPGYAAVECVCGGVGVGAWADAEALGAAALPVGYNLGSVNSVAFSVES